MKLQLPDPTRKQAVASIQRYFAENLPEEIGVLPASMLLDFFLAEIAPAVYNKAVGDTQARIAARTAELDNELYVDEFAYWKPKDGPARGRR